MSLSTLCTYVLHLQNIVVTVLRSTFSLSARKYTPSPSKPPNIFTHDIKHLLVIFSVKNHDGIKISYNCVHKTFLLNEVASQLHYKTYDLHRIYFL